MGGRRGARLGMRCMIIRRRWSERVLLFEDGGAGGGVKSMNRKRRLRAVARNGPIGTSMESWVMQPFEMGGNILMTIMGAYNVNA